MRGIFLSIVVVCALVAAGIGGTLADFSDSEEEVGDTLQLGSLDLKVDGQDGRITGLTYTKMKPEKSYHITKVVKNTGTIDGWLYVHIKFDKSEEWNDKDLNNDNVIDEKDQPEPEVKAETGGKFGQTIVPGWGGADKHDIDTHIGVEIFFGTAAQYAADNLTEVDLSDYDTNADNVTKMSELFCYQIMIDQLLQCGQESVIEFRFVLQDVSEDDLIAAGELTDPGTGYGWFDETDPHQVKFNWWPTNVYQGDRVVFDILYELLQTDYTPPGG